MSDAPRSVYADAGVDLDHNDALKAALRQAVASTSDDASLPDAVEIDVRDLAAHPSRVTVKPGAAITWRNSDSVSHGIVSGRHPDVGAEGEHEHEEVELGRLEVHPR